MMHSIWYNVSVIVSALNKLGVDYLTKVSGGKLSSLRCGGYVDLLIKPSSTIELIDVLTILKENSVQYLPIGAGTNTLILDSGFSGALIDLREFNKIHFRGNKVFAESGVRLPALARKTATTGLKGLEPISGIPGCVGGAVVKNAGCFGREIADLIDSVAYLDTLTLAEHLAKRSDVPYSYRSCSNFFRDKIVLGVTLTLAQSDSDLIAEIQDYRKLRLSRQPTEPSLGSVFKKNRYRQKRRLLRR